MGEQPNRRPATYGCEKCDAKYDMGDETTVFIYIKQPWFNHLMTECPGCSSVYRVWYLTEATIRYMEANNMPEGDEVKWVCLDYAPLFVEQAFAVDNNKPLLKAHDLMPRQEHLIEFFAFLLERGEELED